MTINYRKVLRELRLYKGRTLMALLGILIGIAGIGFVLTSYSILVREMNVNFMGTNPASVVLKVQNLDSTAVTRIKEMNANMAVELRKSLAARIDRGNGTYGTIYLFAVEDFNNLKVDTFSLENGNFPTRPDQFALERDSLSNLHNIRRGYDETAVIKLPGGKQAVMELSGKVHAPGLAPASMEKYSYGFLALDGLRALGYTGWYDEIHLVSYDTRFNREALREMAAAMKAQLEQDGYVVEKVDVPVPGKHPHGDQLKSLLFMLQAFTVISLLVACVIIINLLNFILSKQTRQIAIMKATGADTWDIALPYFLYVLLISCTAIALSIPLSVWAGSVYSQFAAGILNFSITSYSIPLWVFAVQIASGILIPLSAAFYPIYRSCRRTVKEGLTEQVSSRSSGTGMQHLLRSANVKTAIPLNNIFRKKGRTALAILALATGGVLFMTSQNIVASIGKTVEVSMDTFNYDYDVKLFGQYQPEKITDSLNGIEGIDKVEVCISNTAHFKKADGTDSGSYRIKALPRNSEMVNFELLQGDGITDLDNGVIINKGLWDEEPWIRPGMSVVMAINGKPQSVVIAGIVNEVPPMPGIYMNLDSYERLYDGSYKQSVLISAKNLSIEKQVVISQTIEKRFNAAGIEISENWNIGLLRKAFVDHLKIIVNFLSVVAMLAVAVGGLSIASAIGISISERKRELGILRAVGVTDHQTIAMISTEVLLMGIAGWLAGVVLSWPISVLAGNYFGQILLHSSLNNVVSVSGALLWLLLSVTVSLVFGFIPAVGAAKAPLREMLAYE